MSTTTTTTSAQARTKPRTVTTSSSSTGSASKSSKPVNRPTGTPSSSTIRTNVISRSPVSSKTIVADTEPETMATATEASTTAAPTTAPSEDFTMVQVDGTTEDASMVAAVAATFAADTSITAPDADEAIVNEMITADALMHDDGTATFSSTTNGHDSHGYHNGVVEVSDVSATPHVKADAPPIEESSNNSMMSPAAVRDQVHMYFMYQLRVAIGGILMQKHISCELPNVPTMRYPQLPSNKLLDYDGEFNDVMMRMNESYTQIENMIQGGHGATLDQIVWHCRNILTHWEVLGSDASKFPREAMICRYVNQCIVALSPKA